MRSIARLGRRVAPRGASIGTTSSAATSLFTGSSQFAQSLQASITQAVNIASLPITQLNNEVTALQSQSTDLSGLDSKFASLQTAISGIDQAMDGSSYETDISDTSVLSATPSTGVMEGNYAIEVDNAGAYASSMTASSWVDSANRPGQQTTYELVAGKNTYKITPADNSAATVAAAINAQAGNQVQATVVNVGSSGSPDERISLQSTTLGPETLDIQLNGASLQTPQTTGVLASYIVNDSGKTVTSDSRSVDVAPGLTVNLLSSDPGNPVNITVTRSTSALSTALSSFADAYNAVQSALENERGQSSGSLNGQSIVYEMTDALHSLATYASPGSAISGLADLGLTLNEDGTLTFDPTTFMGEDFGNSTAVDSFLGTSTTGGFLKSATGAMTMIEDPTTGIIETDESEIQDQITSLNSQITTRQDQVSTLQQNLTTQMDAADAAIATMEQQYTYLSGMFQAQQVADAQYSGL